MEEAPVKLLVADAGAFIRNAPLREIGQQIYTVNSVVNEIRDKPTRRRLQVLPYELHFKEPSPQSLRTVSDFSKKTGDYPSLSAADLRIIALVYELEKEKVGTDHIKEEPDVNISWNTTKGSLEKPTDIAGFYLAPGNKVKSESLGDTSEANQETSNIEDVTTEPASSDDTKVTSEDVTQKIDDLDINKQDIREGEQIEGDNGREGGQIEGDNGREGEARVTAREEGDVAGSPDSGTGMEDIASDDEQDQNPEVDVDEDEDCDDDDDDDDDDGIGWITPSNISQMKQKMKGDLDKLAEVKVGCITTDFAMQNVLIQMGLNVVSVDGMLIKKAKSYVLRCHACLKMTKLMTKEFCPNCGNQTLQKVACRINDDGSIHYFMSKRKPVNSRGLRYSLPLPRGGKHSTDPILVEDQPTPHQRLTKTNRVKYDSMDPDYVAHVSPFAPKDLTSKSFQLGLRDYKHKGRSRKNPNEGRKQYGRRK